MLSKRYEAKFSGQKTIAAGTVAVNLEVDSFFDFDSGQYISVTLPSLAEQPVREQFRDFSIASTPKELPSLTIIFRQSSSLFKKTLLRMRPGEELFIDGPKGVFTLSKPSVGSVFIAGGVGVTPFLSMIKDNDGVPLTLYYFNNDEESAVCNDVLRSSSYLTLHPKFGRFHIEDIDDEHFDNDHAMWYVSGPPGFVSAVLEGLLAKSVADEMIKTEEFTGYE